MLHLHSQGSTDIYSCRIPNKIVLRQISHRCLVIERQRFPVLRKRMDEVIGNFLREGLEPSETMIGHIIEMEVRESRCIQISMLHSAKP